jgi:HSP20 family protein
MAMDVWRPRYMRRWRPPAALEDMDRFSESDWPFSVGWRRVPHDGMSWVRSIDMYEKEDEFVLRAVLPGVMMADVDISVTGNTLTIKGERKPPADVKDEEYECCEVCYGDFSRSITLSKEVQADKIKATLEDGILEVRLPKVPAARPTKIPIKSRKA